MKINNPLRYPGGKACLAPALAALLQANGLVRPTIAEPYAGAAGASLELLFGEYVRSIVINDLDTGFFRFGGLCSTAQISLYNGSDPSLYPYENGGDSGMFTEIRASTNGLTLASRRSI